MSEDEDFYGGLGDLMKIPDGYYPPTTMPTQQIYTTKSGKHITLNLVGECRTEAHFLWNGAKIVSDYLEARPERVRGRTVLELGAAAGLPSLVAALLGATKVVMTDYADPDLIVNMQKNIDACDEATAPRGRIAAAVDALPFNWGGDVAPLLARLPDEAERRFDVVILADLVFRHGQHGNMIKTIKETMGRDGVAYVFFTSYRPWKRDLDMKFFDVAREAGLAVTRVEERKLDKPMFDNDPGDLEVQKIVNGFELRWAEQGATGE